MNPVWPGWQRLAQNRLLDVAAVVLASICVARIAAELPARAHDTDFSHYYISSRLIGDGQDPYRAPLLSLYAKYGFFRCDDVLTASNPPALVWLLAPLARLPAMGAFGIWVAVQAVSLAALLWLTRRLIGSRLSARGWRFFALGSVASAPVYYHFWFSQVQLPLAVLVLGAFAARQNGRHVMACVLIAVAGLLKLYPLVLWPWFVWRADTARTRALLWSAAALVAGVLASGPALWLSFFAHGLPAVKEYSIGSAAYTVPVFLLNLRFVPYCFHPPPALAQWWWNVAGGIALGLIAGGYAWCWRHGGNRELEFCLLTVVMLVSGVTAWIHYLVLLIFPLAVLIARVTDRITTARIIGLAVLLVALNLFAKLVPRLGEGRPLVALLYESVTLYALFAAGVMFARWLRVPA